MTRTYCPQCREPMRVSVAVEPPDPSVGWFYPQYELMIDEQDCDCELTDTEQSIMAMNVINDYEESLGDDAAERYGRGYDDL